MFPLCRGSGMGTRYLLPSPCREIQTVRGVSCTQLLLRTPSERCFALGPSSSSTGLGLRLRGRVVYAKAQVNDEESESKGQQLWRKELQSSNSSLDLFDDKKLESSAIEEDIQRLAKKQEVERILNTRRGGEKAEEQSGLLNVVEKILVADFFFILFILAWLVAGVIEQSFFDSSKLIDSWLPLWSSVFQPALGVFMAGAIVSAFSKRKDG